MAIFLFILPSWMVCRIVYPVRKLSSARLYRRYRRVFIEIKYSSIIAKSKGHRGEYFRRTGAAQE